MGSEIQKDLYSEDDYDAFEKAWLSELDFVKTLFTQGSQVFSEQYRLGYELEVCILDSNNQPAPCNKAILDDLDSPEFTTELANYDLEINGSVFPLNASTPLQLDEDISFLLQKAQNSAHKFGTRLGLFGVFPSLKAEHFDRERYQSEMRRYTLASKRMQELRHESIKVLFHGEDEVSLERDDVMSEALSTSLQIHFQVPFSKAVEYYHAALFASIVMVGIGANSPLVLGKRAWHESRIPIFEQSVDVRDKERREHGDEKRVHFAHGYIDSWFDLFEQNKDFKIIFPDVKDEPVEHLHHFNLHNGTIWRWIRPIIGRNKDGKWTLRLELRVLPSGPTLLDVESNLWFFIGLMEGVVSKNIDVTTVPFELFKDDFYCIANYGLKSDFHDPVSGKKTNLKNWIINEGVALAKEGLSNLGIKDIDKQVEIIKQRALNGQNGAQWQLKHFEKYGNIDKLVEDYMNYFEQNIPVHRWEV
jgi:gamma-glutamyl:cysteine ligase YbdK (ATP-grasp superfamily)